MRWNGRGGRSARGAPVNPSGALTGLDFPSNGDVADDNSASVRFRFTGAALVPIYGTSGAGVTYLWKYLPRQQTGYYTAFFWGNDDGGGNLGTFLWDAGGADSYYGFHPYPRDPGTGNNNGTVHDWEIAVEQNDFVNGLVVKDAWYSQAARIRGATNAAKEHEFYWNLPNLDAANRTFRTSPTTWGNQTPPSPALTFGDAPWNPGAECASGVLRGFQIYDAYLTTAQINILAPLDTDAAVLDAIAANSIPGLWYLNMNPADVNDISDKSGAGHHPAWFNANRPTLWTG